MNCEGLYFPKCLTQHKNNCKAVVTVESCKQNFIFNEIPEKDASSTRRATERVAERKWDD